MVEVAVITYDRARAARAANWHHMRAWRAAGWAMKGMLQTATIGHVDTARFMFGHLKRLLGIGGHYRLTPHKKRTY